MAAMWGTSCHIIRNSRKEAVAGRKCLRNKNETDRKLYEKIRQDKVDEGKVSYLYDEVEITTETRSTITVVERLENELTKVQGKKTDCLRALAQLHKDKGADNPTSDGDPSLTVQVYLPDNGRDGK